jgi:hypothetical protein
MEAADKVVGADEQRAGSHSKPAVRNRASREGMFWQAKTFH